MNKFNAVVAAGLCLLVIVPATAEAQVKKQGNGYLLRLKLKKCDVKKYNVDTSITGVPASAGGTGKAIELTGTLQHKVLSTNGKTSKVEVTVGAMAMKGGGQPFNSPQTTTIDVDEFGNGKNSAGRAGIVVSFPKDPVKVGGTWKAPLVLPGSSGATNTREATYRFNGIKKTGKLSLADITFSLSDVPQMKSGTGRALLNPADGSLSDLVLKFTLMQGETSLNTQINIKSAK